MTTAAAPRRAYRVDGRDRLSMLLVVVLTVAALLVGLLLRQSVMARTAEYRDPSGVAFRYPDSWRLDKGDAADGIVRVRDMAAEDFPTTFEVRWVVVDPSAGDATVLTAVLNDLALTRGANLTAYKVLDVEDGQTVKGLPALTSSFVFVESVGVFQESIPAVVLGDEYLVRKGDRVYAFNLLASEAEHAAAQARFQDFVDSVQLP